MPYPEQFKVLLRHSNPVLKAGLMAMLACHRDFDCIEDDGAAPINCCQTPPAVVIADHSGGIALVHALERAPTYGQRPRVLIVTHSDRECDIRAALSAGVQGYLLIDDVPEHLAAAIRAVQFGGRILSPRVGSRLADIVSGEPLTLREQAVLRLVIEGLCNKSIANRLKITSGTVKCHLRSAFGKLGAASRTQAVAIAHRRGLLELQTVATSDETLTPRAGQKPMLHHSAWRTLPGFASIRD